MNRVMGIFERAIIDGNEFYSGTPTVFLDLDDGKCDVKVKYHNNLGLQLHPCNSVGLTFTVLVLQDAPECASLSFTIQLVAIN